MDIGRVIGEFFPSQAQGRNDKVTILEPSFWFVEIVGPYQDKLSLFGLQENLDKKRAGARPAPTDLAMFYSPILEKVHLNATTSARW